MKYRVLCALLPVMMLSLGPLLSAYCESPPDPYRCRVLPGRHLSSAPRIDGDLSDPAWQEAAVGKTFVDQITNQPVKDQTQFWLGYDEEAIYFAAYCYCDEPDQLVARATKRDSSLHDDDYIEFQIDPYHTHRFEEFSQFAVNSIGTQQSRMGSGRSGKIEWKGDWKAATQVMQDGWATEMKIPWAILNFPDTDQPTTLGFDVYRVHARLQLWSWFSNIGRQWLNEYCADWTDVRLPAKRFRQEWRFLPFAALGADEQDDDGWTRTVRGGMDVRYRPTPDLTGLLTLNPDFRNVESRVEGIDFSRTERWVGDSRPFFQEGGGAFQTSSGIGEYFYSRRIPNIDFGLKAHGKLSRQTNLGLLGVYDLDDQHDQVTDIFRQDYVASITQSAGDWGSFSITGVSKHGQEERNSVVGYRARIRYGTQVHTNFKYGMSAWSNSDRTPYEFRRGDLGTFALGWGNGRFRQGIDYYFLSPDFQASNGFFNFPGRRGVSISGGYENEWRERYVRNAGIGYRASYEDRYQTGSGFEQLDEMLSHIFSERRTNPTFFRDNVGYETWLSTEGDYWISQNLNIGRFREEDSEQADRDWSVGIGCGFRASDRDRNFGFYYSFGSADEAFRHFISPHIQWKWGNLSAGLQSSILRHREKRQQYILTITYDFSPTISLGGRLIVERDEIANGNSYNTYFSFRRSGEAGVETFLIVGDPSAEKFVPGAEAKILFPL